MIQNIDKGIRSLNVLLAYAGSCVLFGMMLLTIFDVIGRYIFNSPITGAFEITEAMMVTMVFFFIAYAQAKKSHVAVDLVVNLLPKKLRVLIDIITHLLSLLMMVLIAWMSMLRWLELIKIKEYTAILHIPVSPFLLILALGCFAFCIELGKDTLKLFKNGEA
jgi:TRAP-type C4-dicarboxylate transport system permease small subunit